MPELPEVETVVRTLEAQIQGETISYCEVRWDKMIENVPVQVFEKEMKNQTFYQFKRKGKYLIFELSDVIWVAHMRMEGKFYVTRDDSLINKHVHMILALEDGRKLLYHDTRKFGKMNIYKKEEPLLCLERLGKEPWDPTLRADMLYEMYHHSTKSLKEFLLDQSIICGIGNIYANEICFALRKRPQTKMNRISKQSFQQLIDKTKEILEHAICQGGTTIRDYTSQLGVDGRFQVFLMVHGRKNEPCRVCNAPIKKIQWKGRGTYYCPYCQK